MKTLVVYSSLTGNTKLVSEAIFDIIQGEKEIVSINDVKNVNLDDYSRIVVGYWVDKGNADSKSKKFIKSLRNKELAFMVTLGEAPESDHGQKVYKRAHELADKSNTLLGVFLCRGKIDPKLVERMGKFPLNLIHPLTPERLARIEAAKAHPNQEDVENVKAYFSNILK